MADGARDVTERTAETVPVDVARALFSTTSPDHFPVNLSRYEQRVLHALAQGGAIHHIRHPDTGRIVEVDCLTRDGYRLADCTLGLFARLRRRKLIESSGGRPYRISRFGIACVRSQLDNR